MKPVVCLLFLSLRAFSQESNPAPAGPQTRNAATESLRKRLAAINLTKPTLRQKRYIVLNSSVHPGTGENAPRECVAAIPNAVNPDSPTGSRTPVVRPPAPISSDTTPGLPVCESR